MRAYWRVVKAVYLSCTVRNKYSGTGLETNPCDWGKKGNYEQEFGKTRVEKWDPFDANMSCGLGLNLPSPSS